MTKKKAKKFKGTARAKKKAKRSKKTPATRAAKRGSTKKKTARPRKRTAKADAQLLTSGQARELLGIARSTLSERVKAGMPVAGKKGNGRLFDRAAILAWSAQQGADGTGGRPSKDKALATSRKAKADGASPVDTGRAALAEADLHAKKLRAQRLEAELATEAGMSELGLGQSIRAARTAADLASSARETAALFAEGKIPTSKARQFKALLGEARLSMILEQQAGSIGQRQILVTDEGWRIARVFEGIVSDELRIKALRFIVKLARQDLKENPNVDLSA